MTVKVAPARIAFKTAEASLEADMAVRPSGPSRTTLGDNARNDDSYDGKPSERPSSTAVCPAAELRACASRPATATIGRTTASPSQRLNVRLERSSSDASVSPGRNQ